MDAMDHQEFPDPDETDEDEPQLSDEPDEQVALDRLTAAFAQLLGTDEQPDGEAEGDELQAEEDLAESASGTSPEGEATILPVTTSPVPPPVPLVLGAMEPGLGAGRTPFPDFTPGDLGGHAFRRGSPKPCHFAASGSRPAARSESSRGRGACRGLE